MKIGVLAILILLSTVAQPLYGQLRAIALSGDPAPGSPGSFESYFGSPVINSSGQVAFEASVQAIEAFDGIWRTTDGGLGLVASSDHVVDPDADVKLYFRRDRPWVYLDDAGMTLFRAEAEWPGVAEIASLFAVAEPGAEIETLLRPQPLQSPPEEAIAGLDGLISQIDFPSVAASGFVGGIVQAYDPVTDTFNSHLWRSIGNGPELVASIGDTAPVPQPGVTFGFQFTGPWLNSAGQMAFGQQLMFPGEDGPCRLDSTSIWVAESDRTLRLDALCGESVPNSDPADRFFEFSTPSLNRHGQVAFAATTEQHDVAIFSQGSGELRLLAASGQNAPEVNAPLELERNFSNNTQPEAFLGDGGDTVFQASVLGEVDTEHGIWAGATTDDLRLVALEGMPAPGTDAFFGHDSGGSPFFQLVINARNQVAFGSALETADGESAGIGIWAEDGDGDLQMIAATGTLLDVGFFDAREVEWVNFRGNSSGGDGVGTGFNDNGEVAFVAHFVDQTHGVFVSDVAFVPEPSSILFALLGLPIIVGRRLRGT